MIITKPISFQNSDSYDTDKWIINGATVRGVGHTRERKSNQDSINWMHSIQQDIGILSVADGHGSDTYFRSKIGSKIATKIATRTMYKLFTEYPLSSATFSGIRDIIRYSIPRLLVRNWNDEVVRHFQRHPFTNYELLNLSSKKNSVFVNKIISHPQTAYGSTLITAVLTKNYLFLFQIGDGNILIVDDCKNLELPFDENREIEDENHTINPLNYTNSLCMNSSWLEFKVRTYSKYDLNAKLILLATDGYYNSFKNERGFNKIGTDYLDMLNNYGLEYMQNRLRFLLNETSLNGSGDDITLGYLYKKND